MEHPALPSRYIDAMAVSSFCFARARNILAGLHSEPVNKVAQELIESDILVGLLALEEPKSRCNQDDQGNELVGIWAPLSPQSISFDLGCVYPPF